MTSFCPDGYVLAEEAIERASLCWFPEQISAVETAAAAELTNSKNAKDTSNALTPIERLAV
jgi:hypothetical protein